MRQIRSVVMTADYKRSWIGRQYRAAIDAGITFLAQLETESDARIAAIESGNSIASTAANGHATSFSNPDSARTSPMDAASLCGEMLREYETVKALLITSGIAAPTDAQIYAEMVDRQRPVRGFTTDFSQIRIDPVTA